MSEPSLKPRLFDLSTRVLLPIALGLIATLQQDKARSASFLVLATIAVGLSFAKPTVTTIKGELTRIQDRRRTRALAPQLRQLIIDFGNFVEGGRPFDELVRTECCNSNSSGVTALGIVPNEMFLSAWRHLTTRVTQSDSNPAHLLQNLEEFIDLLNKYGRYALGPIFDHPNSAAIESIRPHSRAELEAFREQYVAYRDRVYAIVLEASRQVSAARHLQKSYIMRPNPLLNLTSTQRQ